MLTINCVITLSTVSSGYSELSCRSVARLASLKSDGAERSGERELQKNDGAERSAERELADRKRSTGYGNRLERGADFSPQYSVLCLRCRIFDVWHVRDNARCALSRLVDALSQACEGAFTEKGCTLHGLKGAWHRAVI